MGWLGTRRVPVLLAAATLLPIAALCWLGIQTLAQDRELEGQRRREQLEVAAGRVAIAIERQLQDIETRLAQGDGVRLLDRGLAASGGHAVLFQPVPPAPAATLPAPLTAAVAQEFQHHDLAAATAAYTRIAATAAQARGEALVALASLHRRQFHHAEALRVYDDLERLGAEPVAGGQPAALVARQGRSKVYEATGDTAALAAEVSALAADLARGRWAIDRPTFDLYRDMLERWGATALPADAIRRTEAAVELWHAWRSGELPPRGRRLLGAATESVVASWVTAGDGPTAAFLTAAQLQQMASTGGAPSSVAVSVLGMDGRAIVGARSEGAVLLSPADTRMPFVLALSPGAGGGGEFRTRRGAVIVGLVLAFGLIVAASFGLYRITTRELLLARQQSDFVAAVSHEFRTPLTSMRHLTELLAAGSITSAERKAHYYGLLARETDRLHRMVETLLSFGRIDAGAHVWRLEPIDVAHFVSGVVEEFDQDTRGRRVDVDVETGLPPIHADREALFRALWNLLENAAKYSPPESAIRVFARATGPDVLIGVQDSGSGIPAAEQPRVFDKFVRGDEARRAGIRGVGIGLALVKRIAEAHGGSVRLESEAGRGSTFTLVMPCRES